MTDSQITSLFVDNWVRLYGTPTNVQTDTGMQLMSKLVEALWGFLSTTPLKNTVSYTQTQGQVECFTKTIIERLWECIAKNRMRLTHIRAVINVCV